MDFFVDISSLLSIKGRCSFLTVLAKQRKNKFKAKLLATFFCSQNQASFTTVAEFVGLYLQLHEMKT